VKRFGKEECVEERVEVMAQKEKVKRSLGLPESVCRLFIVRRIGLAGPPVVIRSSLTNYLMEMESVARDGRRYYYSGRRPEQSE
jgi:hypothetical protein